ncbi:albusnodin/ikarugamycin family macrolactam cyclase [Kitasatospora sp. NPDC056184]|uniref:albusnodin/ikarugamycin family macrolactam cyclase n=1 Tax=Kitasatospora sp. NPDC056184 TaxID=3345738 RepID=UPI0035DA9A6D
MPFGGFSSRIRTPVPDGAVRPSDASSVWTWGEVMIRTARSESGGRRLSVLGPNSATDFELQTLADSSLPPDLAWRWAGAYVVVEESDAGTTLYTDPAAAQPVYLTAHGGRWAWSSSSRFLASLTRAPIDSTRLATAVFAPSLPGLVAGRTFFHGIEQLPPGSRVRLASGCTPEVTILWRPESRHDHDPARHLRRALERSVQLRVNQAASPTSDLSGGLDSSTITLLASRHTPEGLRAITVHPKGDESGADLRYARLVAASNPRLIAHHLMPLGTEHLPYTAMTDVPASDEPAPSTITQARLLGQFRWMLGEFSASDHLTGDGGDSVLFQHPLHLADLFRHRRITAAVKEAAGWARLRHLPFAPVVRDAVRSASTSRFRALTELAEDLGGTQSRVRWFDPVPFPGWAGPEALPRLRAEIVRAAGEPDPFLGLDYSVRALVDEIREVSRTAQADADLARSLGLELHNPFLDPCVVDALLRTPLERRPPVYLYKPVLVSAMGDLLPARLAARTTKGSFNADHFGGMRANLKSLLELADGHLAVLGLVEPATLRRTLRQAAAGIPMSLATLEQALSVEAWLCSHRERPAPAWAPAPEGNVHA